MPEAPPVTIVAPKPSKSAEAIAAEAAKVTISAAAIPGPVTPPEPPKPGSARAKLHEAALSRFGDGKTEPKPKPTAARPGAMAASETPPEVPESPETPEPGEIPEKPAGEAETQAATAPAAKADETKATGKMSPWKLVDQFKERAVKAEARALELEKELGPEPQRKASAERVQTLEKQVQEMTEELRYYRAEKYDPDVKAAQEQYEGAWKRAMSELSEIPVIDPGTGQPRAMTPTDLLELVNLPLGKAREIADAAFGKFSDDVMNHRKEILSLFQAKAEKLEALKKTGADRDRTRHEQLQKVQTELQTFIKTTYEQATAEALADPNHGEFFKPREGDDEWNTRLEKGFKLVDEAYALNVADPKLTPEQRRDVIRRHAAVRNRAASWGALRFENKRLKDQIASLEKDLASYKGSTPNTAGRTVNPTPAAAKPWDSIRSGLAKIAH